MLTKLGAERKIPGVLVGILLSSVLSAVIHSGVANLIPIPPSCGAILKYWEYIRMFHAASQAQLTFATGDHTMVFVPTDRLAHPQEDIMATDLTARFQQAAEDSKKLPKRPDNNTLLKLYSLYKQATAGDVTGSRPGGFDMEGKMKYDAWAKQKGKAKDAAMQDYIDLVESLKAKK